jgi:hypothetical protein
MVRLDSGEMFPFLVDTGAAITCFDKSLEPKLGNSLGTVTALHFGVAHGASLYAAPRLWLGNTVLAMNGTTVIAYDFKQMSPSGGTLYVGILGMPALQNYCIQLDFAAHRIRFLAEHEADKKAWGKPFPLQGLGDGCVAINENLVSAEGSGSLIDTGCPWDGWLTPACFQRWTNQPPLQAYPKAGFHYGEMGREMYPGIELAEQLPVGDDSHIKINEIGLRFLARHRVTLDFPNHTMYLKRTE